MNGGVLSGSDGRLSDAPNGMRADGVNEQFGFNLRTWNTVQEVVCASESERERQRFSIIFFYHPRFEQIFSVCRRNYFLVGVCVGVILILVTFHRAFYLDVLKMTVILTRFR